MFTGDYMFFPGIKALYVAGMATWFIMLISAILNGVMREIILAPRLGAAALPLSALSGAAIFTLLTYVMLKRLGNIYTNRELLTLGFLWLIFTILFEFIFGHYALKKEWSDLLSAYDLRTGNLWSVLLLYMAFLPLLVAKWLVR